MSDLVNDDFSLKTRFFEIDGKKYEVIASRDMGKVKETIDTIKDKDDNYFDYSRLKLYLKTR